jgi:hypothetical protein
MIYNEKDIDPYCEGKTYNDVFYFLTLGITMVEKRIFVFGLAVVLALGTLGFNWVESVLPTADAHGVQAQLQSRLIRN